VLLFVFCSQSHFHDRFVHHLSSVAATGMLRAVDVGSSAASLREQFPLECDLTAAVGGGLAKKVPLRRAHVLPGNFCAVIICLSISI
jgi:hypothetical protein